jgi:choline dehydrogenase-like flavoprotein
MVVVKVELPGVGQNFQDHALLNLFYNREGASVSPRATLLM